MQLFEGNLLHVYNRGNNRQLIFFNDDNYQLFLDKANEYVGSVSDILAYCLMPNHFHFLIHVNEISCATKKIGSLQSTELHNGFRILQSSYAYVVNKEYDRTGSLFQQKTKFKLLNDDKRQLISRFNYAEVCFNYIHQNPVKAGLTTKLEDWKYSSFGEYLSVDGNRLCNKVLAVQMLDIEMTRFYENSYAVIKEDVLEDIWLSEKKTI